MTASKNWAPFVRTESQELSRKISWYSSSSSDEAEDETKNNIIKPKYFKPHFPVWGNCTRPTLGEVVRKDIPSQREQFIPVENIHIQTSESNNVPDSPLLTHYIVPTSYSPILNKESSIDKVGESPILLNFSTSDSPILNNEDLMEELKNDSPVLSQCFDREESPVLTNSEMCKRKRSRRKKIKIEQSSPDIFMSQASQVIQENESPEYYSEKVESDLLGTCKIEIPSTQECSSAVVVNSYTSESTSYPSVESYHQPNARRKTFKRGGLYHQVQKALDLQSSRISLWHHDIFCEKIIPSQEDHFECIVKKTWKDFGVLIAECEHIIETENKYEDILLCIGHSIIPKVSCDIGQTILVFPPFKEKLVEHNGKKLKFYHNILKVLNKTENSVNYIKDES